MDGDDETLAKLLRGGHHDWIIGAALMEACAGRKKYHLERIVAVV